MLEKENIVCRNDFSIKTQLSKIRKITGDCQIGLFLLPSSFHSLGFKNKKSIKLGKITQEMENNQEKEPPQAVFCREKKPPFASKPAHLAQKREIINFCLDLPL